MAVETLAFACCCRRPRNDGCPLAPMPTGRARIVSQPRGDERSYHRSCGVRIMLQYDARVESEKSSRMVKLPLIGIAGARSAGSLGAACSYGTVDTPVR